MPFLDVEYMRDKMIVGGLNGSIQSVFQRFTEIKYVTDETIFAIVQETNKGTPLLNSNETLFIAFTNNWDLDSNNHRCMVKIFSEIQSVFACPNADDRLAEIWKFVSRWVDATNVTSALYESTIDLAAHHFLLFNCDGSMKKDASPQLYVQLYRAVVLGYMKRYSERRHGMGIAAKEVHIDLRHDITVCDCAAEIVEESTKPQKHLTASLLFLVERCCCVKNCRSTTAIGMQLSKRDGYTLQRYRLTCLQRKRLGLPHRATAHAEAQGSMDTTMSTKAPAAKRAKPQTLCKATHAERPVPMSTEAPAAKRAKPQTLWDAARAHAAKRGVDMDRRAIPLE
jgi:hypothetical protein